MDAQKLADWVRELLQNLAPRPSQPRPVPVPVRAPRRPR